METSADAIFNRNYQSLLQHLTLKELQPKTIDAYSRAIRRIGERFDYQIANLSEQQFTDYFTELVESHSWSTVKLDLYGLKFYYAHVYAYRTSSPPASCSACSPPPACSVTVFFFTTATVAKLR